MHFANCGCRMELLAKTEMCEMDGGVRLWSRHLRSIIIVLSKMHFDDLK